MNCEKYRRLHPLINLLALIHNRKAIHLTESIVEKADNKICYKYEQGTEGTPVVKT